MKIGNAEIRTGAVLGPMAGITDMPFRALCIEQGASLTYTEMISAKALFYKNKNTLPLLEPAPREHPLAVQLFGNEPELLADEARKLEDGPYDIFDVNMGCPVPKVVNNNEGSALMKDPKLIEQIVRTMAKAVTKPVTVKIRKGYDLSLVNAVEVARRAEDAGASAIAIHGRLRSEFYSGQADWDIIRQVKEAVSIPVIGSGDVVDGESALKMIKETGCDAVMIARSARGNPWIFAQVKEYLETGRVLPRPAIDEVKAMVARHYDMMEAFAGEWTAVRQMRQHVGFYVSGYKNAASIRREINKATCRQQFMDTLAAWE
ncbi:MAG: tRNA dihydrouridine synthase DusB [Parasporobacterium sp.]|nr:tRNA dihydrouridine synthase DusB [Parasporobacterium sp.]